MLIVLLLLALAFVGACFIAFRSGLRWLKWLVILSGTVFGLIVVVVAVCVIGIAFYSHPESGIGLASVPWLDSRASDIAYYRSNDFGGSFVYEFAISRPNFDALARERHWAMREISDVRHITRYNFFLPASDLRLGPAFISVKRGIFYNQRQPNGGGTTVTYDADIARAYVEQSSR